jgi:hypothetical protein
MVALPSTYVPDQVEAATGGGGVPAGKYRCVVLGSQEKDNKAGTGSYVEFKYQVTEGPHKDADIFQRFNFNNQNKQAVDIAFAQFKQLAEACGKPGTTNTDDLNNSVIVVTYGPQKNAPEYNEVKKIEAGTATTEGYVAPAVTAKPAAQAATATPSADGKPSWA